MNFTARTLSPALALVLLAGCTVGPNYAPPEPHISAAAYSSLDQSAQASPGVAPTGAEPLSNDAMATWWKSFNDPVLNSLIERSLEGNLDLKSATARIREARALLGVSESARFPTIGANGSVSRGRTSQNLANGFANGGRTSNLFDTGLDASYEIDVFGGVRRSVEASGADLDAAIEGRRAVLVSLLGEVARSYIDLRGYQQRVLLSRQIIGAAQETVNLTSSRFTAGLTGDLDVAQAQGQLASRQGALPVLESGMYVAAHRLAVLLGKEPAALLAELSTSSAIPQIPSQVPVGLPSDLLRRRPDIRQAERALAANTARIGVATAGLYPRFSLTGSFGFESGKADNLFSMDSHTWSIGPSVRWNLFTGGLVRSQIAAAGAREEQSLYAFDQTLLVAFQDVEDSLTNFIQEQARRTALNAAVQANTRAVTLSTDRYRSGVGDFLTVLDAQRQLYDTQDQLVQSESLVTRNLISLYKALGGGWSETDLPPANSESNPASATGSADPGPAPAQ